MCAVWLAICGASILCKKEFRDIKEASTAVDIQKNGEEQREPEGESSQKTWKIFPTWKFFEIIVLVF